MEIHPLLTEQSYKLYGCVIILRIPHHNKFFSCVLSLLKIHFLLFPFHHYHFLFHLCCIFTTWLLCKGTCLICLKLKLRARVIRNQEYILVCLFVSRFLFCPFLLLKKAKTGTYVLSCLYPSRFSGQAISRYLYLHSASLPNVRKINLLQMNGKEKKRS